MLPFLSRYRLLLCLFVRLINWFALFILCLILLWVCLKIFTIHLGDMLKCLLIRLKVSLLIQLDFRIDNLIESNHVHLKILSTFFLCSIRLQIDVYRVYDDCKQVNQINLNTIIDHLWIKTWINTAKCFRCALFYEQQKNNGYSHIYFHCFFCPVFWSEGPEKNTCKMKWTTKSWKTDKVDL